MSSIKKLKSIKSSIEKTSIKKGNAKRLLKTFMEKVFDKQYLKKKRSKNIQKM